MRIVTALVLLAVCGIVLEVYQDWSGQPGNGTVAESNTITVPVDTAQGTLAPQAGDGEAAAVADQAIENTEQSDTSAIDKVKSDTAQEDAIQRIDMNYTKIVFRV